MDLRLYDTASREKRPFVPLDPGNVRMYVCGPTVYDFAHIGNARPVIVFDVLFRLLRHVYGKDHVTYVRNITDVDDKINARAARDFPGLPLNEAIRKVTEVTANQFYADAAALGCLEPTVQPRATDFVLPRADGKADMVTLIKQLIARGHAYEAGGEVLFDTRSMPDYGALSGRKLDEQLAGARVAVDAHKRNSADFVLWKQSSADEPGWDSPWGRGRPGWHIECSAMSAAYLGEVFDIHGGGLDLIFPHHENEIAQSRCAHGTSVMANYWLHNEFVQVEGAKMSKSLGNFVTIREILQGWRGREWAGNAVRLAMLSSHYRTPLDWSKERISEAEKEMAFVADHFSGLCANCFNNDLHSFSSWIETDVAAPLDEMLFHICDDLNTPAALAAIRSRYNNVGKDPYVASQVLSSLELLGVVDRRTILLNGFPILRGIYDPEAIKPMSLIGRRIQIALLNQASIPEEVSDFLQQLNIQVSLGPAGQLFLERKSEDVERDRKKIEHLIGERNAARARKDFAESDRIRDELASMGIVLKDRKGPDGKPVTTWEIAR
ncbi:cysteine--tRNA ligase [Bradyrhizobium ontarionense]|uniref:Cysteine--tRNA ligase n=2 Tax=Bradyrhizobium ontarionense TaxID=2898149 RepID=A0ABY3RBX6_9BRAD|nr:cysteine--tRNA ligase [Bradyrhizobium sp. A19]UFZ04885.1 cysteine--tRNA ligase [Bradyrhizobium sp. A19]